MNSFKIFIPLKAFRISANALIYGIVTLFFLPFAYELLVLKRTGETISAFSKLCFAVCLLGAMTGFFLKIFMSSRKKQLYGSITEGQITFEREEIKIDNAVYALGDIEKINFICFDDYLGRKEDFSNTNYNGRISNGVDNCVELMLKNRESVSCYFQLTQRYQIRDLRDLLIHYHLAGKLHFLNLAAVLGIEDYNAIQNFKKTLENYNG